MIASLSGDAVPYLHGIALPNQNDAGRRRIHHKSIRRHVWLHLRGNGALFQAPTIQAIAKAHGKTPVQIIIRWHIQEGFSVIPGATRHDYIKENISVFDFKLSDEEMAKMRALNKEKRFFNMDYKQAEKFVLGRKMDD